jgi:CRISPR-associated protein Cas1
MPVNEHVEAGRFDHRRLTHPELSSRTRKEGDTLHTRSVSLSSKSLGLTGILDILEEKDADAYPVETKHGSAPRDDAGQCSFWSNDAVQLCGQALLLEEHLARPVPRGVLYYAGSRERVDVPIDDPLRRLTQEALAHIRDLSARPEPPAPSPPPATWPTSSPTSPSPRT